MLETCNGSAQPGRRKLENPLYCELSVGREGGKGEIEMLLYFTLCKLSLQQSNDSINVCLVGKTRNDEPVQGPYKPYRKFGASL